MPVAPAGFRSVSGACVEASNTCKHRARPQGAVPAVTWFQGADMPAAPP